MRFRIKIGNPVDVHSVKTNAPCGYSGGEVVTIDEVQKIYAELAKAKEDFRQSSLEVDALHVKLEAEIESHKKTAKQFADSNAIEGCLTKKLEKAEARIRDLEGRISYLIDSAGDRS